MKETKGGRKERKSLLFLTWESGEVNSPPSLPRNVILWRQNWGRRVNLMHVEVIRWNSVKWKQSVLWAFLTLFPPKKKSVAHSSLSRVNQPCHAPLPHPTTVLFCFFCFLQYLQDRTLDGERKQSGSRFRQVVYSKRNAETGHVSRDLMSLCLGMIAVFYD